MRCCFIVYLLWAAAALSPFAYAEDATPRIPWPTVELSGELLSLGYRSDAPDKVYDELVMDASKKNQAISVKAHYTGKTDSLTATFYNNSDNKKVKWQHVKTKDSQPALIDLPPKAGFYRLVLAWAHQPDDVIYYKNFREFYVDVPETLPELFFSHLPSDWPAVKEDTRARTRLKPAMSQRPENWVRPENLGVDYMETSINGEHKERVTLADSEYQDLTFKTRSLWKNGQCLQLKAEVFWLNGSSSAQSFNRCFNNKDRPVINIETPLPGGWVRDVVSIKGKVVSELPLLGTSTITAARIGHENEPNCTKRTRPDDDGAFSYRFSARDCAKGEGEWLVSASVTDQLGNTSADIESNRRRWSADFTPPTLSISWPPPSGTLQRIYHNGHFSVWGTATDTGSKLASVSSFIDNQAATSVPFFHDGTFKAELSLPPKDVWSQFRAQDRTGNVGITAGQTLFYDGQAPNNTWKTPEFIRGRTLWLNQPTATFTVTAVDQLSGTKRAEIALKKETGLWGAPVPMVYQAAEGTWTSQLELEPDTFYQVRVRSHDYAGNVSAWLPPGTAYYKSAPPSLSWPDNALQTQPGKLTINGQVHDTLLNEVKAWVEYCNADNEAATCLRSENLNVDRKGFFTAELTEPMLSAFKNLKIRLRATDVTGREAPPIDDKNITPLFSEFSLTRTVDDRDQSGGITPGDKVTLKLVIDAAADSNYVSLKLMLPPGLNSDTSEGLAIQIDPESHITPGNPNALPAALNFAWTGQGNNDLLATGNKAPDLKAGDRIIFNIPVRISDNLFGKKFVAMAKADSLNNIYGQLSIRHIVETQSMFPASRAIKTDIYSPTVKPDEKLPLGAPFVYRMRFEGGEWPALGAQLDYKLPVGLLMNGPPVVTENSTSTFIAISENWDGRQNTRLFSEATLNNEVKPGKAITVDVPVKLDLERGGELKSVVTAIAANVTGKQQKVHCVYADVGDVYVYFYLCSQPVE